MIGTAEDPIYIHLPSGSEPPQIKPQPCRMVVLIEDDVSPDWQARISKWIVDSGCLAMMAWGNECSSWDDSVDIANLEEFDYGDIPEEKFVMTSWFDDQPVEEAFWYCRFAAFHPAIELPIAYIVDIAPKPRRDELLETYRKNLPDDETCLSPPKWHGLIKRLKFWG